MVRQRLVHQVQQRRHEVDLAEVTVDADPIITWPGNANHHRHLDRRFVERAFFQQAVVADHVPVIAGENHDGAVGQPRVLERRDDPADLPIHERDVAIVVGAQVAPTTLGGQVMTVTTGGQTGCVT